MCNAQALLALPHDQMVEVIRRWNRKKMTDTQSWNFWARDDQAAPLEDWRVWLVMAGRGYGKTRMGAEWVRALAAQYAGARFALVGATLNEARAVMVEGESGLLSLPFAERPIWEPSLRRLTWANGAMATLFSAAEPESLRGPQHDFAWADEIAKWSSGIAAWDNLMLGLRLGENPRAMATTTPRPVPLVRRLYAEKGVAVTRGRTVDNDMNLPPDFIASVRAAGRHVPSADQPIGQTRILALELPLVPGGDPNKPVLAVFAAGTEAGWKRAALSLSTGDQWSDIGTTALPAVIGNTQNAMGAHHPFLLDEASFLDIELLHAAMSLESCDTSPLAVDAPIFWIDGEFVRVGRIIALGGKSYRLSRFSRGLASSAMRASAHAAGAQIIRIDATATRIISENMYQVGQSVTLEALGLGDTAPVKTVVVAEGLAITPLPPVHGCVAKDDSGNFDLHWKRRSRLDLGWVDGVDQAQAEDQESYRVGLYMDDQMLRKWTVTENHLRISTSEMAGTAAMPNSFVVFKIQQIGRFALSGPLTFGLN
jgi:hypothetical protein